MRRAGTVVGNAQSVVVVRAESDDHAAVGDSLVDERLESAGRVVDVFGPVERPYLAVSLAGNTDGVTLVGETLYAR